MWCTVEAFLEKTTASISAAFFQNTLSSARWLTRALYENQSARFSC